MKRFFLAVMLMLPICVVANDKYDYGVNVPEWSDFAPSAYVDVEQPKYFKRMNVTANYWYDRKVEFENELANCKALESNDERFSCYEKLKVNQFKQNTDYNARIEAKMNANSGIPEMHNRTDTMLPINNYINTFSRYMPNEIR